MWPFDVIRALIIRCASEVFYEPHQFGGKVSDIFQEIDEDLRQDKVARLWKAYGKYIVALAVLIILAIASDRFI